MRTPTTYYKVLGERQESCHGGSGTWWRGIRRVARGPLELCSNGIHLCRPRDLVHWLGPQIWVAAPYGAVIEGDNKVVARGATLVRRLTTWNEKTSRLFAADCAEKALRDLGWTPATHSALFAAVDAARAFARGAIIDEQRSAAWSAAWSAAESAAESAARSAARSAAWSAMGSAVGSGNAAACAWSAAAGWAAQSAAGSAARSAAWSAAAESAARSWQTARLFQYLNGERTA